MQTQLAGLRAEEKLLWHEGTAYGGEIDVGWENDEHWGTIAAAKNRDVRWGCLCARQMVGVNGADGRG